MIITVLPPLSHDLAGKSNFHGHISEKFFIYFNKN